MWIIWPFAKKNFGSAWSVCADFRRFVDPTMGRFIIQDEKRLPHPKQLISESIFILMLTETDRKVLEAMKACAFELAFFQKGVGDQALHPLGIDMDTLETGSIDGDTIAVKAKADPKGKEKYDRFKLLRDADWDRMQAKMAGMQRSAKVRP